MHSARAFSFAASFSLATAALLVTTSAAGAGGVGGKGDTGGKGGSGPKDATQAGAGDASPSTLNDDAARGRSSAPVNPDTADAARRDEKPWELGGTWETHRLIRQEDLGGAGASKVFNVLFLSAKYDITDRDRISAGWGLSQRFLADSGETGFRGTDITLAYTRLVPLPEKVNLRAGVSSTIPLSYYSQVSSSITSPGASLSLSRRFGDLALDARLSGGVFFYKYREAGTDNTPGGAGGVANPKYRAGGSLSAEYSAPFHRPLSFGAALTDSYIWFYDVGSAPSGAGGAGGAFGGAVQDAQFASQSMLQSYGGEIFLRYVMPTLAGFKSDLTVALASGDPSLGYNAVLHEGVVHPYLFYRQTAETYAALSVRY
jgi:hypothetical protein